MKLRKGTTYLRGGQRAYCTEIQDIETKTVLCEIRVCYNTFPGDEDRAHKASIDLARLFVESVNAKNA